MEAGNNPATAGSALAANPPKTIPPTVGRVVYYRMREPDSRMSIYDSSTPLDAHIVYVHSDTCVNLVVFDHSGNQHQRTSVPINVVDGGGHSAW
ncbi:hypothetical protein AC629_42170, partial [Bradyrhizobium sp. NAS80.1]|uniref:hypothetical protein n=1 Tax=Bradyrhizobium sp. NAS80.1 TaxID=1680159 RepID=UPI0009594131